MTKTMDSPKRHTASGAFFKFLLELWRDESGGSGGGGTSKATSEPWQGAQEPLKRGYAAAEQFILDRPTEFFPGSTVIPFAPETTAALGAQANRAYYGSPLLGGAQDYTGDVLGGDYLSSFIPGIAGRQTEDVIGGKYLSPETNPFFADVSDSVLSAIQPEVASSFSMAGRTGGSALHAEALGRGVSRGIAPYLFNEYGRERSLQEGATSRAYSQYGLERNIMQDAASLAPDLAREDYYDIDRLGQVGAIREGKAGEGLSDQLARWDFSQSEPGRRAQAYISSISGIPMPTNSTTRTTSGGSKGTDIAGLGLQAAGTAGALGWAPFALGCWVAREVYGADNPKWLVFREWMFTRAPDWLLAAYLKYGEQVACWLRGKERSKAIIRKWMDSRVLGMSRS